MEKRQKLNTVLKFPSFYQDVFIKWINKFTSKTTLPSMIFFEFIWFNANIKVDSKPVYFFCDKNLNFIGQLFNDNGNVKPWRDLKTKFHLKDNHEIYWLQITDALPKTWKDIILEDKGNTINLVTFDHPLKEILKFVVLTNLLVKSYI